MVNNPKFSAQEGVAGTLPKSKGTFQIGKPKPSAGMPGHNSGGSSTASVSFEEDKTGISAGDHKISAWGKDNLFPNKLRSLYANNIFPGLMDFKVDMMAGADIFVYHEKIVDNKKVRVPVIDQEVEAWLEDWDFYDYLVDQFTDFAWVENAFCQFITTKDKKSIAKLVHVNAEECRLTVMDPKTKQSEYIVVSDWEDRGDKTPYPAFNRKDPLKHTISMYHCKKKSFLFNYYNYPVFIGALQKWIPLANEIPGFHLARLQNSINAKYHIKIPVESLKALKELKQWNQKQLDDWLTAKLKDLDDMLAGSDNAGKTFYSFKQSDPGGKEMAGWEIVEIKNNEKEMSEANLRLFNETNQAITSAVQVQPSLACIQLGDKMSSGSEVLNSYNLHIKTRTPIARRMVLRPVNMALAINFPDKSYKIGIEDAILVKQEIEKKGYIENNE
jgi:hypothetical protein